MPRIIGIESGTINVKDGIEEKNGLWLPKRGGTVVILVLADTVADTYNTILNTPGIPQNFDLYDIGWVKNRDAVEDFPCAHPDTGFMTFLWRVTVTFDSDVNIQQGQEENNDDFAPDEATPKVSWSSEEEDEVMEEDEVGDPVVTKCGEPLFMEKPTIIPILTITRLEEPPFDQEIQYTYCNKANSVEFWNAPPGCAVMKKIHSKETTIQGETWCEVSYEIKFKIRLNEDGDKKSFTWIPEVLHQGYKYFKNPGDELAGGKGPTTYMSSAGHPAKINLDANGFKNPDGAGPVYLPFVRYLLEDLNALNLGPDF